MRPLFNSFQFFYSPDDTPGSSEGESDTFELLNAEEPEEVLDLPKPGKTDDGSLESDDETPEDGEDEGDEKDELKEIEEELQGPKEEDLELTTPVRRREILAKYPKLFKDFPYLEKAYYREQQFTETFPTIQDAKAAAEKANIVDRIDRELMNGDISSVLRAARSENPEAFNRIADNYLPTLKEVDPPAFYHVVGNVLKDTIITMVREGRALGEQGAPLQAAANILNQFIFGSQNFTPPTTLSRQQDPQQQSREQQIQREDQQRFYTQFESVKDDLQTKADNVLKSTIDQHIDPRQSMTDYVRGHATKEALSTLDDLMSKDKHFRGLLDRLWEKAFEQRFSKESTDRIKSAYLSKAKTLLPSVIKRARNDALRGLGRRSSDDIEESVSEKPTRKGPAMNGKSTPPSSGKIRKASDIPKGMSTLEFLSKG
jgi:hypothetical protein